MSSQPFDSLSKQLYDHLIPPELGRVEISLEVLGESLFIDVVVTPNPNPTGNYLSLGLLGRVIQRRCILETYRNAPTAEATNICMLKRTWYFQELRRRATRAKRAFTKSDRPQLWIVTPTASDKYLEEFNALPKQGWPPGVYGLAPGLHTGIIVIHHLPVEPETLWFRLLGRGLLQANAAQEVLALPDDDPLRSGALQLLSSWKIVERIHPDLEETNREFNMALSQAYLEWEKEVELRGELRGKQEGKQEGELLGKQQGKQEVALNMLRGGIPVEQIAQFTGLSLQQIQQLQSEFNNS